MFHPRPYTPHPLPKLGICVLGFRSIPCPVSPKIWTISVSFIDFQLCEAGGGAARQQLGLITHRQARDLGLSTAAIQRRVERPTGSRASPASTASRVSPDRRSVGAGRLPLPRAGWSQSRIGRQRGTGVFASRRTAPSPRYPSTVNGAYGSPEWPSTDPATSRPTTSRLSSPPPDHLTGTNLGRPGTGAPWYRVRDLLEHLCLAEVMTRGQPGPRRARVALTTGTKRLWCAATACSTSGRLLDRPTDSVLESAFADLCEKERPASTVVSSTRWYAGRRSLHRLRLSRSSCWPSRSTGSSTTRREPGFIGDRYGATSSRSSDGRCLHFTWAAGHPPTGLRGRTWSSGRFGGSA